MKRKHILGVLCVVLASACYGITPILSNAALNGGLPASFVARLFPRGGAEFLIADASREMTNECVVLYSMGIASLLSLFNCLIGKKRLDVSGKQLVQLAAFGGGALAGTLLLITYAYLRIPANDDSPELYLSRVCNVDHARFKKGAHHRREIYLAAACACRHRAYFKCFVQRPA